jgi:hypothetical protein
VDRQVEESATLDPKAGGLNEGPPNPAEYRYGYTLTELDAYFKT